MEQIYNGSQNYEKITIADRIRESLDIIASNNKRDVNSYNNKMYAYVLLDWNDDGWKPVLRVKESEEELTIQVLSKDIMKGDGVFARPCDEDNDCSGKI